MTINDQTPVAPTSGDGDVMLAREAMASAIRERAGLLHLDQKGLSDASGIKTSTLGNYWHGRRSIPVDGALFDIARALEVTPGSLVDRAAEIMREGR